METGDDRTKASKNPVIWAALVAFFRALRPQQWVKNLLVLLPFVFAVDVAWSPENPALLPVLWMRVLAVLLAFCALSSGVYLFNDLMDRSADRLHPLKRHRPIAAGLVNTPTVVIGIVFLVLGGMAVMILMNPALGVVGVVYLGINLGYSVGMKHLMLADVLAVASGYVIRAVAGALAIGVAPSPWLYATTAAGALFIVLGKRYAEVRLAGDSAVTQRSVLRHYAGPFIGQLLNISATAALVSYTLYTVEAENLPDNHTMLLTVPLVVYGLFRYLFLLNTSRNAESPEQLIAGDLPLMLSILSWIGVSAIVLWFNA